MFWDYNLAALFTKAGFTRWPLLLCSAIGMAIILERSYYFIRLRFDYARFSREIFILLNENQLMKAIHYCQNKPNPVPHIAGIYLRNFKNKRRDSILSREGSIVIEKVESRLGGLATITHVAPLLGLLGTVAGLVVAFHEIELSAGQVQAQNLAGGIWEALLSTVFGLVVAIPCMVTYHGFEGQADRIARRMQSIVSELDEFFGNKSEHDFNPTDHKSDEESKNVAE